MANKWNTKQRQVAYFAFALLYGLLWLGETGRDVIQTDSRHPLIAEAQVQSQSSLCGICDV